MVNLLLFIMHYFTSFISVISPFYLMIWCAAASIKVGTHKGACSFNRFASGVDNKFDTREQNVGANFCCATFLCLKTLVQIRGCFALGACCRRSLLVCAGLKSEETIASLNHLLLQLPLCCHPILLRFHDDTGAVVEEG